VQNWWPDERVYAGKEHLDPTYVAAYEGKSGYDPAGDIAALRALGLDEESLVLDLRRRDGGVRGGGRSVLEGGDRRRHLTRDDLGSPHPCGPARDREHHRRRGQLPLLRPPSRRGGRRLHPQRIAPAPGSLEAVALKRISGLLRPGGVLYLRDLVLDC